MLLDLPRRLTGSSQTAQASANRTRRSKQPSPQLGLEQLEERVLLATIAWKAPVSGNFSLGNNWEGNVAPGPNDIAVIDKTGGDYTVTLDADSTVAGFALDSANATFTADHRSFAANGPATLSAGSVLWCNSNWTGTGNLNVSAVSIQASLEPQRRPFQFHPERRQFSLYRRVEFLGHAPANQRHVGHRARRGNCRLHGARHEQHVEW
jgi:hypothetical protein